MEQVRLGVKELATYSMALTHVLVKYPTVDLAVAPRYVIKALRLVELVRATGFATVDYVTWADHSYHFFMSRIELKDRKLPKMMKLPPFVVRVGVQPSMVYFHYAIKMLKTHGVVDLTFSNRGYDICREVVSLLVDIIGEPECTVHFMATKRSRWGVVANLYYHWEKGSLGGLIEMVQTTEADAYEGYE